MIGRDGIPDRADDPVVIVEEHVRYAFAAVCRARAELDDALEQAGLAVTAAMRLTDQTQVDVALARERLRPVRAAIRRTLARRTVRHPLGGSHDTSVYDKAMRRRGLNPATDVPPRDLYETVP